MSEREQILHNLQQLSEAIVAMFGKNCEVCIHDLRDFQNSLVHINGTVTGRNTGMPATDLLVKAMKKPAGMLSDMHNYRTMSGDGRTLKSSTIFIRDRSNKPIFAFCINFDTTEYFNAVQTLQPFLADEDNHHNHTSPETFSRSPEDTIDALFQQAIAEIGKQPATMTTDEKTSLVELLEAYGAFQFKGSVEQIALLIGVTKYTVYNYLKKIHARQAITRIS